MADARRVVVGVDGGGTKTDAIVVASGGRVLGEARGGAANWETVGLDAAGAAVRDTVQRALGAAGIDDTAVAAVAFALAGCDWPSDHDRLATVLAPTLPDVRCRRLVNDAYAALRAGATGAGVCSIAGTGGSTCGRGLDGREARTFAVSWGEASGATGIVLDALHALAAAHNGGAPASALAAPLCDALGVADVPALFEAMSRSTGVRLPIGPHLAPLVFGAAREGDALAREIASGAAAQHARDVLGVARRLDLLDAPFTVVRAGGVHRAGEDAFDRPFVDAVVAGAPLAECTLLGVPPVVGAACLAGDLLGVELPLTLVSENRQT